MSSPIGLPKALLVRGVNHVLEREPWAMQELQKHNKKIVHLILPLGETWLQINASGHIELLMGVMDRADLSLEISNESLMRLGETTGSMQERAVKAVKIAGDAELAQLISKLAGQLRWEYEEDLARVIGDAPAHLIVSQAKRFHELSQKAILDLQHNAIEYLIEEKKVLVHQRDFLSHKMKVQKLREAVERLEKRIAHLQKVD